MRSLLLFGAPGSGKGTQSAFLVEREGYKHISTGDLFRDAIKRGTPLGRKAQEIVDQGRLVPDDIVVGMVEEALRAPGVGQFILDGFPRTLAQAERLEELLDRASVDRGPAVFLEVPEDVLVRRLIGRRICRNCGAVFHVDSKKPKKDGVCDVCEGELYQRKDDSAEVVGTRLKAYEDNAQALKAFYKELGLLRRIDGNRNAEDVFKELKQTL